MILKAKTLLRMLPDLCCNKNGVQKRRGNGEQVIVARFLGILTIMRSLRVHSNSLESSDEPLSLYRTKKLQYSGRGKMRAALKFVVALILLLFMLSSCRASDLVSQNSWKTYQNPRYKFEFPYPSSWESIPMPDNLDGRAFRDPNNPNLEIRGWALNQSPKTESSSSSSTVTDSPNFTTEQGVTGQLQVKVGVDTSMITLALKQEQVEYHWQGQSDSEQFADYYRFFNYVASRYRLPPPGKS